ncbi:ankyrin repeat-containing protein At5g02620-like [Fagus crenata]
MQRSLILERETNLLVAMLVATVTFAAAFTMPGGYKSDGPDQGLANLTAKVALKAFVIFDTTAISFSVIAVSLQLDTSQSYNAQIRYMNVGGICTSIAITGMELAFAFGMHVVLAKSIGLAINAYVMGGCLILSYHVVGFLDPGPAAVLSFHASTGSGDMFSICCFNME